MLSPLPTRPVLRIGIYRTSSLGDVVLATACLDFLAALSVPTEVLWVGRGASLAMVTGSWPHVKGIELTKSESSKGLAKAVRDLKECHFFIDLQGNLRSQWLGRRLRGLFGIPYFGAHKSQLARSRMILEARMRGRRKPLPQASLCVPRLQYQTMVDTLRRALRDHLPLEHQIGLETESYHPRLPIPDQFDPPWRKELRFGAWLGVAPGAAHPTKEAPLDILAEILLAVRQRLQAMSEVDQALNYPLGLVFFGDQKDREKARLLLDRLQWTGPVLNLAGRLSLWESAVALHETNALLSNDSSLSHIAEAVDTPTAVLFGPTIEAFGFKPRLHQSRAFSSLLGCRPCSKHGKLPCRYGDKLCFTTLNTNVIANHLSHLLTVSHAAPKMPPNLSEDSPAPNASVDI